MTSTLNLKCLAKFAPGSIHINITSGDGNNFPKSELEAKQLFEILYLNIGSGTFDELSIKFLEHLTPSRIEYLERLKKTQNKEYVKIIKQIGDRTDEELKELVVLINKYLGDLHGQT